MRRKLGILLAAAALAVVLGGCSIRSPEELFELPKLPEEFSDLQTKINEVTTPGRIYQGGADLISPVGGTNTQNVQLRDLDGDGAQEAIAFFRASGEEKPLKIYIFARRTGAYEARAVIEGDGTSIYAVTYENLTGGTSQELLVSWQLSANVRNLEVYGLREGQAEKLMEAPGYTNYKLVDVDRDNLREVLTVHLNTVEGVNRVECWQSEGESMAMTSSAPLSMGINGLVTTYTPVQQGNLRDRDGLTEPALFVTAAMGEGYTVTDVFAWVDGALKNVTLDGMLQYSITTLRQDNEMSPRDVNADGLTEVPMPEAFAAPEEPGRSGDRYYSWRQFDTDGNAAAVYTTFHGERDKSRWYFVLPDSWSGVLAVSSRDSAGVGERQTVFSYQSGEYGEDGQPKAAEPFLILYRLTGSQRETRAAAGSRFVLCTDGDAIYAAELLECSWDCGLTADDVKERFMLVTKSYSAEP